LSIFILAVASICAWTIGILPSFAQTAPDSVTIPAGQKFIMQLENDLHTRTTKTGDKAEFTTAADVVVDNQVVIPNKSLIRGTITKAKRAGLLFGRAEIQMRFDEIKLPDGSMVPLKATIIRVGFDPLDPNPKTGEDPKIKGEAGAGGDAKNVASASAQGAIIGIIYGGPRGAMYGAGAGAAIAVAQMALKRGPDLDLPRSTMFEAKFDQPLSVPAKSLQAKAPPPVPPADESQVVAIPHDETQAEEGQTAKRPVLKRRDGQPAEARPTQETASSEPTLPAPEVIPSGPPAASSAPQPSEPVIAANTEPPVSGTTVPTFGVKVRMVQVDAVVRDRAGRMIDNLKAEDFMVYEDGVLQQIETFSHDELPLAVALVVDRSGSVAPYISELRRIANRALQQLKPQDEVCLFSFAESADRLEGLTTDRRRIADAIDRIHAGGGTDIVDALHDAVNYLARTAPDWRHAVILVSDNQQTVNSQASESETIKTAMESDTVVYSLKTSGDALNIGAQLPSMVFKGGNVSKIAQETGGEVINVNRASSIDTALGAVISRLRMRYSFGYYPTGTAQGGMFHEIKVRLTDSHGKAGSDYFMHAKRGYYATASRT